MVQLLWRFLQTLKMHLLCDPAISPVGVQPRELKIGSQRNICTPILIAALFTIAKSWKQSKGTCRKEQIYTMWSINIGILFSMKKAGNSGPCYNVEGPLGHYDK